MPAPLIWEILCRKSRSSMSYTFFCLVNSYMSFLWQLWFQTILAHTASDSMSPLFELSQSRRNYVYKTAEVTGEMGGMSEK